MQPKVPSYPKAKAYRLRASSASELFTSRNFLFILTVNWLLQGVRGMDRKELSFRLLLLACVALGLVWPLTALTGLSTLPAAAPAVIIAHTLNFLVNGQFWVCLRYCPGYRQQPAVLAARLASLLDRVAALPWLEEAVLIGSTARRPDNPGPRSDVDLRLVFPPGLGGWLRVNLLLLELRAMAFVNRLPLDVYAYEHPASLRRFDQSEPLGILLDRRARLRRGFANRELVWLRR